MNRMVIVSNRLPVTIDPRERSCRILPSSGGLTTALRPVVSAQPAVWVGWPGADDSEHVQAAIDSISNAQLTLAPVFLTAEEKRDYYFGFANEILWPLFHDLPSRCCFLPRYWQMYEDANRKFAQAASEHAEEGDPVWVHDYHLIVVARELRKIRSDLQLSYFHHIPFPPPEIFNKLPARDQLLSALLDYDRVGFQTRRDRRNFIACVRERIPRIRIRRAGPELVTIGNNGVVTEVGVFPISINFSEFDSMARNPKVIAQAASIRANLPEFVLLGVDRLDYTKGVPERLRAYRLFLERNSQYQNRVVLVQVTVPSREQIPSYLETRTAVERLVSEINGEFGTAQWMPIHYVHRSLPRPQLVAHYLAANAALVTSLKDGMNLVAKEFCAARTGESGALVLSEFAGAACELGRSSLLVNPSDAEQTAAAIATALRMDPSEQKRRMRLLRDQVRRNDVRKWCSRVWGNDPVPASPITLQQALAVAGD
jgi:trehalose 6-phosphate synthase/phosphatase